MALALHTAVIPKKITLPGPLLAIANKIYHVDVEKKCNLNLLFKGEYSVFLLSMCFL